MYRSIGLESAFLHFSSCSSSSSTSSSSRKNNNSKKKMNNNDKMKTPRINEILSSSSYKCFFDNTFKHPITESCSIGKELRSCRRMDSSDDEVEVVAQSVTDYYFEDDQDEPISFAALPIRWSRSEASTSEEKHIFLHGTVDSGFERIHKKVIAWTFEYSNDRPEVSVLSTDKRWIKLQKPRKSFADTLRTILITIQCLYFLKKHPDKSESSMWRHLQEAFSFYKVKPSDNDVFNHLPLIHTAIRRDRTLEKSTFMHTILSYTKKRKVLDEQDVDYELAVKKAKLIIETDKDPKEQTETANVHLDLSDSVCALCDNGGELFCCDGGCLRAFHATEDADLGCKSLRLSKDQLHAPRFICKNCQYSRHQCFACGKLGSSNRANIAEVFPCSSETCGHFYHPRCVAKLLHPISESAADQIQKKIFAGESFTCPVHKCMHCKEIENDEVDELQFAICRRCPKVYHKGCLPGDISFETSVDKGIFQRAWKGLLPKNRILIYCMKHKIDKYNLAPVGDYIIFPDVQDKKKAFSPDLRSSEGERVAKKIGIASRSKPKRNPVSKPEVVKKPCALNHQKFNKTNAKQDSRVFDSRKKSQITDNSRFHSRDSVNCASVKGDKCSAIDETDIYLKDIYLKKKSLNKVPNKGLQLVKSKQQGSYGSESNRSMTHILATKNSSSSTVPLEDEMEMRKVDRKKEKSSFKTVEVVERSHEEALTQVYYSDNIVDNPVPPEQLEGSDKDVENTMQNVEDHSFSATKADYESGIFDNVTKSKAVENTIQNVEDHSVSDPKAEYKSEIFDNVTKAKIVDKLDCYAQDGDMVVNFCCHVNDFSCLMRQKLAITGKNCSSKHYDVFQSKGDFDLKEDDWKSVSEELLTGSRLIVGVKFPSVVQGVDVNKFINKILEFKPKLLLLICTRETER
ncbi:hypothetical protein AQUCO_02800170v1 [Aquilegia coerulea]|nr:hypothetical protein AQUCO_02800170v1 [Aquilegia coerulea]